MLRGGSVRYTAEELDELWNPSVDSSTGVLKTLLKAGFFRRLPPVQGGFEVAMLYRPALELSSVQSEDGLDGS